MFRPHSHSLGGGLVLGLVVAGRPLWIFAAGVVVGVALVFAVRALRRLLELARRLWRRRAGTDGGARDGGEPGNAARGELPLTVDELLTRDEIEAARLEGLRQGARAGIRRAAREGIADDARRAQMQDALDAHWQRSQTRMVERAVQES